MKTEHDNTTDIGVCQGCLTDAEAEVTKLKLQNDEARKALETICVAASSRPEAILMSIFSVAQRGLKHLSEKRNCEHDWIGGSMEGYRCTKCPAVAGKYCGVCHEPMEGNRMGPCWKCQPKVIDAGARCNSERRNEQCAKHQGHDGKHGFGLNEWS